MKHILHFIFITFFYLLVSCGAKQEKGESASKFLVLKKEQLESMDISLAAVTNQSIRPIVFATGKVALQPNSKAIINSNIAGKIEHIHVMEGDYVKAGQPLVSITSMQLIELQQNYLAAKNDMEYLHAEYERQSVLKQSNIASEAEYQQTHARYMNAKNSEESIKEKLKLAGFDLSFLLRKEGANVVNSLEIRSPISGSVFKVHTIPGMSIESSTGLIEVINLSKIYADVDVYEQDLDQVVIGQGVEIEFINKNMATTKGFVKHIVNAIDPESRSVKIHVDFSPIKGAIVLPEMAVKVKITGNAPKVKKPTILMSALLQEGELSYIYYAMPVEKGYEFHKSKVLLGENDGTRTEFATSETLPTNALIVTQNVYLVDAENKKRAG